MIRHIINRRNLRLFILSSREFILDIFSSRTFLSRFRKKKNGISVLLPTQNEELMVKTSILSFLDFADEIIVVDNGSEDNTKEIIKELAKKFQKIRFFDKPGIQTLFQNRQFAFRKSKYRWICRFDSDFVAYNHIKELRKILLEFPRGILPKVISIPRVNVSKDFYNTKTIYFLNGKKVKGNVITLPEKKIYEYFPLMCFMRFKRREIVSFQEFMKEIVLRRVYYMHCDIKSSFNSFMRSERPNWRNLENFKKYPTLKSYILDIIKEKYGTSDLRTACKIYTKNEIENEDNYIPYNPNKYLPYPELVEELMIKSENN
ncbi:MAG: glycosyltransferase family 2 protein [Candidatus Hodarchaeota archaeon]